MENKSSLRNESGTKAPVETKIPQRGALQVTITPASPIIAAGGNFSIAVTIANPFEVPIIVGSVSTSLPIDLYDAVLAARLKEKQKVQQQIEETRRNLIEQLGDLSVNKTWTKEGRMRYFSRLVFSLLPVLPADMMTDITSMAFAQAAEVDWKRPEINAVVHTAAKLFEEPQQIVEQALSEEEIKERVDNIIEFLEEEYQKFEADVEQQIELQPGDSITKTFTLRTKKGIMFRPSSYNLNILVSYKVDMITHIQSIPYNMNIQAALNAVIIGAVIGSIFGFIAHNPNFFEWTLGKTLPEVITALVLSGFAVIAFARKEGVQPIIAVQDFWGGLLTGFLVGYSGLIVLGSLFGANSS